MNKFVAITLFACAIHFGEQSTINIKPRVVGGRLAEPGEFPYMASLQVQSFHGCGGSILTRRTILTAAHCLYDMYFDSVYVGSNILNSGGKSYRVSERIQHPKFVSENMDVAVIHLAEDIEFSSVVQPIELDTEFIGEGQGAVLSGWGQNSYQMEKIDENRLKCVNTTILAQDTCISVFQNSDTEINPYNICAFTKVGEGACTGDSGDPLVKDGKQIGIASKGVPCAQDVPDIYTRISEVADWIKSVTK